MLQLRKEELATIWAVLLILFMSGIHCTPLKPSDSTFSPVISINQSESGEWWFVSSEGQRFISKGVVHTTCGGDYCPALGYSPFEKAVVERYGNCSSWRAHTLRKLQDWNFNTLGAWSDSLSSFGESSKPFYETIKLDFAGEQAGERQPWPDVFAPEFEAAANATAMSQCYPRRGDPNVIGYFTDNELIWGSFADRWPIIFREEKTLLIEYLQIANSTAPGRVQAMTFLKEKYASIEALNLAWNITASSFDTITSGLPFLKSSKERFADYDAFAGIVAKQYFSIVYKAIRMADPTHLILGCKYLFVEVPRSVLEASAPYIDVNSYDMYYDYPIAAERLGWIYNVTKKPVLIGECSFKALDSGLPNSVGAGIPVATQAERTQQFWSFVHTLAELPYVVGYHWFQYSDEPFLGRFDGENSNFGVVNGTDSPWLELTTAMTKLNGMMDDIHSSSS